MLKSLLPADLPGDRKEVHEGESDVRMEFSVINADYDKTVRPYSLFFVDILPNSSVASAIAGVSLPPITAAIIAPAVAAVPESYAAILCHINSHR